MNAEPRTDTALAANDLTRTTFAIMFLVLLTGATLWIARPFALPMIWGATIATATWPILRALEQRLWGKRWLATSVMVSILLALLVVPIIALLGVVLEHVGDIDTLQQQLAEFELPAPPPWVAELPMVGERVAAEWQQLASDGPEGLAARVSPHAGDVLEWLLARVGGIGFLVFEFLLTTLFAGVFFARGEVAAAAIRGFAARLAGEYGERATVIAGQTIRGVALGVVVTALVQAVAGGVGLAIAGVPAVALLTAVMFLLSVAQIGAVPVLAVATLWLFWSGQTGWGVAMAVWTVVVGSLDNVLRPLLIRRGVELPLFVIFAGVLGGLVAFGVIGIFVGPVVVSVTFVLMHDWVHGPTHADAVNRKHM